MNHIANIFFGWSPQKQSSSDYRFTYHDGPMIRILTHFQIYTFHVCAGVFTNLRYFHFQHSWEDSVPDLKPDSPVHISLTSSSGTEEGPRGRRGFFKIRDIYISKCRVQYLPYGNSDAFQKEEKSMSSNQGFIIKPTKPSAGIRGSYIVVSLPESPAYLSCVSNSIVRLSIPSPAPSLPPLLFPPLSPAESPRP